jgi:AraC-like DNA-binding protein
MRLNYYLGVGPEYLSVDNTPGAAAKRLPFYTTAAGFFAAGAEYFTEREGMEDNHLLFYTVSGQGSLNYRGQQWELTPGSAALINCGEYQRYATASATPWVFKWVHIGGAAVGEYESRINRGAFCPVPLGEDCKTDGALDDILRLLREKADLCADVRICEALMGILTELVTGNLFPDESHSLHRQQVRQAIRYMQEHYRTIGGVDEIVAHAHLSKYYFLRQFKAHTGMGLYEFLNSHRVDVAKGLLRDAACTVGAAAQAVGFNDVNCFIRYFKKVTGVTPAVYRKYYMV